MKILESSQQAPEVDLIRQTSLNMLQAMTVFFIGSDIYRSFTFCQMAANDKLEVFDSPSVDSLLNRLEQSVKLSLFEV